MSSQPEYDGHKQEARSQISERLLKNHIPKLLSALRLEWISRRGWLTFALSLLGVTSALAIWQLHWTAGWHEPWTIVNFYWWTHPLESNPDAALPRFNRRLEAVAIQDDRRVWVAGEGGFLARTEDDGLHWTELKYNYDATTGELRKSPPPNGTGSGGSTTVLKSRGLSFQLVPHAFAEVAPAGIVPSDRTLSFTKAGESQLLTLTNETRYTAYVNSVSVDPRGIFDVENECKTLEPGQRCVLNVRFNSSSADSKGQLTVRMEVRQGSSSLQPVTLNILLLATERATSSSPAQQPAAQPNAPANAPQSNAGSTNPGSPSRNELNPAQTSPPAPNSQERAGGTTKPKNNPAGKGAPDPNKPARNPAVSNGKPRNPELTPEQVAALEGPALKLPTQLGTILAMEWNSAANGRMVTEDGVSYQSSDGGETWQFVRLTPSILTSANPAYFVGDKELLVRSKEGRQHAVVIGRRIADQTLSAYAEEKVISIARNSAGNAFWMVEEEEQGKSRILRRGEDGVHFFNASRAGDEGVYWRWPAPWYWFLALPLVLLAAAAAGFAGSDDGKVQASVSNIGISDRPLEPGEPDVMNLNALAQGVSLFLRNKSTKPPLVIAVNGDWGTGKSSLMNLLQHDLQRRGARAVWFNAWHHQEERQLLAALLQTVRKKAVPSWYMPLGFWLRVKLIGKRGRQYWLPFAILFAATMFLISLGIDIHHARRGVISNYTDLWVKAYRDFEKSDVIPSWLKHASLYSTIAGLLYGLNGLRKGATAFGANPASLLASISGTGRIKDLEAQTSFREQFATEFRQVVEVLGSRRLLIVIDDLDRCQPEKVGEVLETVNFLISSADCFVILGLARAIVEHCVGLNFAKVVDTMPPAMLGLPDNPPPAETAKRKTFARRYLDKLVQLELSLPQLTTDQARTLLGAEPAAFLSDEIRRKLAELQRRRRSLEERLRGGLRGLWAWAVPLAVCVGLALTLWHQAHSLVGPVMGLIDRQLQSHEVADTKPPSAVNVGASVKQGAAIPSQTATPAAAAPSPAMVAPVNSGPGVLPGSSAQPEGWIQSWPALLILIWILWFSYDAALRRTQLISKDSPLFRVALDVWSPLVMSVMNTPRSAKRFLNRVRYLAMRQRALSETQKPSLLDRFTERVSRWLISGSNRESVGGGLAPDPGASVAPAPRSLGAAAAQPAVLGATPVPESLLVALAAIHLVPGAWKGLLENDNWENLDSKYLDLINTAVSRHQKDLGDWSQIRNHVDAYLLLCSEVVTH
jgi:hypothetical protein